MTAPGDFSAGDVLTAADMNALPGGIVAQDILTSNASLTTSDSFPLSVTFTADAARQYLAIFTLIYSANNTAGAYFVCDVQVNAVRVFPGRFRSYATSTAHSQTLSVPVTGSGSLTVRGRCLMTTGTGVLEGSTTTTRTNLTVIDVGTL